MEILCVTTLQSENCCCDCHQNEEKGQSKSPEHCFGKPAAPSSPSKEQQIRKKRESKEGGGIDVVEVHLHLLLLCLVEFPRGEGQCRISKQSEPRLEHDKPAQVLAVVEEMPGAGGHGTDQSGQHGESHSPIALSIKQNDRKTPLDDGGHMNPPSANR